jgi:hypothetical protein
MEHLAIDASPAQLRKLKKGEKVRIKKGTGFNLLVHPETYSRITRSFSKGKGSEISLSQAELDANTVVSPEQHAQLQRVNPEGRGIFGKKFDKFMSKTIGDKRYGAIYKGADALKPAVKAGVKAGLTMAGTAATPFVATYAPMLAPFIPTAVAGASMLADDYIDDPDKYQQPFRKERTPKAPKGVKLTPRRQPSRRSYYEKDYYEPPPPRSGLRGQRPKSFNDQIDMIRDDERMNHQYGTNYNYMGRATMQQALADNIRQKLSDEQIEARYKLGPEMRPMSGPSSYDRMMGITGSGINRDSGFVGLKGGMIDEYTPQAMQSQPYGVNFQMQHFLPPQYHKYNAGTIQEGMSGTGVNIHPSHMMAHLPPALQSQPSGANFMMKNFLPTQFQDIHHSNPIFTGQGLGVGLYAGKGMCGNGMYL